MQKNKILLSFDLEEFDFPREKGFKISLEEGVKISSVGAEKILKILEKHNIKATFFTTGNFAQENKKLVKKIANLGHEISAHGVNHFEPRITDPKNSKIILEKIIGKKISGYRQPRMFKIDPFKLEKAGFKYDSSLNPAFIPGRYNNFKTPRLPFKKANLIEIPTSTATSLRIPLFWLSFHLFPKQLYLMLVKSSLKCQNYFTTYFHPWEFTNFGGFKLPWYIRKNSGDKLVKRFDWLIQKLRTKDNIFVTYSNFIKELEDEDKI